MDNKYNKWVKYIAHHRVIGAMEKNKVAKGDGGAKEQREVECKVNDFHQHSKRSPHRNGDIWTKTWGRHKNVWKEHSKHKEQQVHSPWVESMSKTSAEQQSGQHDQTKKSKGKNNRKWEQGANGNYRLIARIMAFTLSEMGTCWIVLDSDGMVTLCFKRIILAAMLRIEWRLRVADTKPSQRWEWWYQRRWGEWSYILKREQQDLTTDWTWGIKVAESASAMGMMEFLRRFLRREEIRSSVLL